MKHLSIENVLRAERNTPGSEYADIIAENMRLGRIEPMEMSTIFLRKAVHHMASVDDTNAFLVDGIIGLSCSQSQS